MDVIFVTWSTLCPQDFPEGSRRSCRNGSFHSALQLPPFLDPCGKSSPQILEEQAKLMSERWGSPFHWPSWHFGVPGYIGPCGHYPHRRTPVNSHGMGTFGAHQIRFSWSSSHTSILAQSWKRRASEFNRPSAPAFPWQD